MEISFVRTFQRARNSITQFSLQKRIKGANLFSLNGRNQTNIMRKTAWKMGFILLTFMSLKIEEYFLTRRCVASPPSSKTMLGCHESALMHLSMHHLSKEERIFDEDTELKNSNSSLEFFNEHIHVKNNLNEKKISA